MEWLKNVDVWRAVTYIFGSALGIAGSILVIPLKIVSIAAVEKVVGKFPGVAAWTVLAGADGFLAIAATDRGLKEENTLAKGVLLGFGTTEAFAAFWDVVCALLATKGRTTEEIASGITGIAEKAIKLPEKSEGSNPGNPNFLFANESECTGCVEGSVL